MYLQITTKCNMRCKHCGFACTSKGEDMSLGTFHAALQWAVDSGSTIVLGGGEPTIHPHFWQILGESIAASDLSPVWLATNGKKTEIALALAKMASRGVIGCALSRDQWHGRIDSKVVEAFTPKKPNRFDRMDNEGRDIRTVTRIIKSGRAKTGDDSICICDETFVKPNGDVMLCGCQDSIKIGNVFKGFTVPEDGYGDRIECVKRYRVLNGEPKESQHEILCA